MGSEGGELGGTSSWGQHIVSFSDELIHSTGIRDVTRVTTDFEHKTFTTLQLSLIQARS